MSIITDNLTFDLIAITTTILVGLIAIFKWRFTYWSKKGLATLEPTIPFGDAKEMILGRLTMGEQFREFYKEFKSRDHKHAGVYMGLNPIYMPIDPELIKNIMAKDFANFMNHGIYHDDNIDPLSGNLFNLEGTKWRNMRVKLTPTFTSGKMKMMFQTLADCAVSLKDVVNNSALNHTPVDIKEVLASFSTDIIGSVAFGVNCNSLKDPNAEFRKFGRKVFEVDFVQKLKMICMITMPHSILRLFRFKFTRSDVERFFMKAIRDTVDYREKNHVYRKDFMHLLLQLKNRGTIADDDKIVDEHGRVEEKALTMNELAAQAFVFFAAGFETSSTTMTWALFELARNPDIQEKLRKEITSVLDRHGELTYDALMDMPYLEQVINETLRKYPPLPTLNRKATENYTVPNTTVQLKKGDDVVIPVLALHTDPEYYPNPEKFEPERFSNENKNSRPSFTWLPFGEGPRLCIGLRFGMMQTKVGLITILNNYSIKLNSKTRLPLQLDKNSFITSAEGGIWLDVEKTN